MIRRALAITALFQLVQAWPVGAYDVPYLTRDDARALFDSLSALPPDPDLPPVEPPPVVPPPTPPSDPGCRAISLGGAWLGWCGDERRNFREEPGGVGVMLENAKAARPLPAGTKAVEVEVYLGVLAEGIGGQHLLQVPSGHVYLGTSYEGWVRPDIWPSPTGWVVNLYNHNAQGGNLHVDVWRSGAPIPALRTWGALKVRWRFVTPTRFELTLNGRSHTFDVQVGSRAPNTVVVGNMDSLSRFGPEPWVKFRAWRFLP